MKMKIPAAMLAVLVISAVPACVLGDDYAPGTTNKADRQPMSFTVTGEAQAMPETANIRFTIVGDGDTIVKAEEALRTKESSVIKAEEKLGVKADQVQTERFSVTPLLPSGGSSGGAISSQPIGYRLQRDYRLSMPVTGKSLGDLLKAADAAFEQGARLPGRPSSGGYYDQSSSSADMLEFVVGNSDELTKKAMTDGIERARKLAAQAAEKMGHGTAGVKLFRVQMGDSSVGYGRYSPTGSSPVSQPIGVNAWQPIKVRVSIQAEFGF